MRKERSSTILLNQLVHPDASLGQAQSEGQDGTGGRAFVFEADDFATGELLHQTFAIRFKTAEAAADFGSVYARAQERNRNVFAAATAGAGSPAGVLPEEATLEPVAEGDREDDASPAHVPIRPSAFVGPSSMSIDGSAAAGVSGGGAAAVAEPAAPVTALTTALQAASEAVAASTAKAASPAPAPRAVEHEPTPVASPAAAEPARPSPSAARELPSPVAAAAPTPTANRSVRPEPASPAAKVATPAPAPAAAPVAPVAAPAAAPAPAPAPAAYKPAPEAAFAPAPAPTRTPLLLGVALLAVAGGAALYLRRNPSTRERVLAAASRAGVAVLAGRDALVRRITALTG